MSDIFGCDPDCAALLADRADGAIRRGVSMAESGARDRPFTLKRVKRFLRMTPRCRPVREWKYGDGWGTIFPRESLKSDTTTHADGTQSTKPKSDGALLATHVPYGEVSSSAQAELAASCERRARFGLSHTRTPLSPPVCLRAARKALTEDAASGRRKPHSRYSCLSMALSQRFRGNFVSPLKLQFLTHLFPGCCRRGLQWDGFMTLLPQKCVRLIHPTYKKLTKNNNY